MIEKPTYKELQQRVTKLEFQIEESANELIKKDIALTEILKKYNEGKQNITANVTNNVNKLILPALNKLIDKSSSLDKKYLMVIKQNLEDLTSTFSSKLLKKGINFTPKENEICLLIRGGFSIKEIATLQNLSERTVESHRLSIRKKLGIDSAKTNLATYLSEFSPPHK